MNNIKPLIILTRPEGRANSLITKLHKNNYSAINIPCLTIDYLQPEFDFNPYYSKFIFVSVNAVEGFFKLDSVSIAELNKRTVFAIGATTAEALKAHGINHVIHPAQSNLENSEDFIKLAELQNIKEDHIVLVRGDTSREFISTKLANRCAGFLELIVYQGVCPGGVITHESILSIQDTNKLILVVTSASILANFYNKLDANIRPAILKSKILVPSKRIAKLAQDLGFKNIYCSNSMNEETILDMINKMSKQI